MTEQHSAIFKNQNAPVLRIFAVFLIGFFLIMTLLTAFVAIPQINKSLETQHMEDSQTTLEIETELFKRFVSNHKSTLEDFAKFPVIVNATLLSDVSRPEFIDLINNFVIAGEKSRLVLQNVDGDIIYQTTGDIRGDFTLDTSWLTALINGTVSYNFQLLEQEEEFFRFVISIPVKYRDQIKGILSAEISKPLSAIFSPKTMTEGGVFKLQQDGVVVSMDTSAIALPREVYTKIALKNLELTYISDGTIVLNAQHELRSKILRTFFGGLAISFLLFTLLGYRTLANNKEEYQLTHKAGYIQTYTLPIVIGVIGVTASIAAYFLFQNMQAQQTQQDILSQNKSKIVAIERSIDANIKVLDALKAFFDSSTYVDRQEFKTFVQPLLKNHADIQALEWIPKIKHSERARFESLARKDGFPDFNIYEQDIDGQLIAAPDRKQYYPVYYVEPHDRNSKAFGLDSPNNERRNAAILSATKSGKPTAAGTFELIQEENKQLSLLVFNPIFKGNRFYSNAASRHENLKGFVVLVLRLGDTVKSALGQDYGRTNISIRDISDPQNPETIFGFFDESALHSKFVSSQSLSLAGRRWEIRAFPNVQKIKRTPSFISLLVLFSGFAFTFFTTYTFFQLIRRRQVIEGLVEKRTEEIKNSKQFQDLIMSSIPDLLFVKDDKFRIIEANPAFLNVYPENIRDKIIGTTTLEKYAPEETEAFLAQDKKALEEGYSETEESILFPDGTMRTLFTKKVRFENTDGESFVLGIGHDITEKKQAEDEILRSNIELERFAYVASHDLQEPLRMVTNFTALLEQSYAETLDDQAREYISFAYNGACRMHDLVNDLLEYSRIGQEAENFKDVNLNDTMKLIKDNLKESIDASGASITYDILPTIHTNPVRLMRVLQNLIGNSIKYQISSQKPEIHIETKEKDGTWTVSIIDNGIGMKPEYCEQIFEPFKRLHSKDEYVGTGMGLAICRKIIEGFGGRIWVQSSLGEGASFFFTIPAYDKQNVNEKSKNS